MIDVSPSFEKRAAGLHEELESHYAMCEDRACPHCRLRLDLWSFLYATEKVEVAQAS